MPEKKKKQKNAVMCLRNCALGLELQISKQTVNMQDLREYCSQEPLVRNIVESKHQTTE